MEERSYHGRVFDVPQARGVGVFAAQTRWRLIADGIVSVLAYCPAEHRALVANLQYAWMQASLERERLTVEAPVETFSWPT
jgi:hypothetical protein